MRSIAVFASVFLTACAASPVAAPTPAPVSVSADTTPTSTVDWTRIVEAEAEALAAKHADAQVRIVVFDPVASALLASVGPVEQASPTGSSIKPLTVYAALVAGLDPSLSIDASDPITIGDMTIEDHRNNGVLTLQTAIARSSNIAIAHVLDAVPWTDVYPWVESAVGLPAADGLSRSEAVAQLGGFTTQAPLERMVRAYAQMERDPDAGAKVLSMLEAAVGTDGTGHEARVEGLSVLGKTGTARGDDGTQAVFIGRASNGEQSVWIGVSVGTPGTDAYGSTVAAPAFARISAAALSL